MQRCSSSQLKLSLGFRSSLLITAHEISNMKSILLLNNFLGYDILSPASSSKNKCHTVIAIYNLKRFD